MLLLLFRVRASQYNEILIAGRVLYYNLYGLGTLGNDNLLINSLVLSLEITTNTRRGDLRGLKGLNFDQLNFCFSLH